MSILFIEHVQLAMPEGREAEARAGYLAVHDEPLEGFMRFYAHDPFGNRIEFMQPVRA